MKKYLISICFLGVFFSAWATQSQFFSPKELENKTITAINNFAKYWCWREREKACYATYNQWKNYAHSEHSVKLTQYDIPQRKNKRELQKGFLLEIKKKHQDKLYHYFLKIEKGELVYASSSIDDKEYLLYDKSYTPSGDKQQYWYAHKRSAEVFYLNRAFEALEKSCNNSICKNTKIHY